MRRALPLAFALLLLAAGSAQAVHWPYFGGDAGRSGLQPVDQGATPVSAGYQLTSAAFAGVRTPVVTSAGGGPATQRFAFGTAAGLVHLRVLATGAAVGPEGGRDVVETGEADPFGASGTGVGFADTSVATALGQLFVVHNEADGIEIAQIDEASGDLVVQKDVAGTAMQRIESSAVATGTDASGARSLFFVADDGTLVKVPIARAGARDAAIGEPVTVAADATPDASPTFANLGGVPHVLVGTADARLRSYKVSDLTPGPASAALVPTPVGGSVQAHTPSVPVGADGTPPATAPSVTLAASSTMLTGATATTVQRLVVQGSTFTVEASSDALPGAPSSAIALGARTVVTTASNLYSLDPVTFKDTKTLSAGALPAGQGFASNSASVSGVFVYVARDNGEQLVLRLADAQRVPAGDFTSKGTTAPGAVGQPSLSRGFVQYGTSQGLFVYRNRDLVAPVAALAEPAAGRLTATASDARGIASVAFRINGKPAGTDAEPDAGSPFNAAAPATFSAAVDPSLLVAGTNTIDAVASDGTLTTVTAPRQVVVAATPKPKPPPASTGRRKARAISARLAPRRDRRAPYRFTVSGKLTPPTGVTRAQACRGRVAVRVRTGRRTLVTRRVTLRANCTYRVRVSVRSRRGRAKLTVRVRFEGNPSLSPQTVRTLSARVR